MWMGPRLPRSHGLAVSECFGDALKGRVPAMRVEDREKKGCKFGCLCERLCVWTVVRAEGQEVRRMRRWN
jgi:hypothetical protein